MMSVLSQHISFLVYVLKYFVTVLREPGPTSERCFLISALLLLVAIFFISSELLRFIILLVSTVVFLVDGYYVLRTITMMYRLYFWHVTESSTTEHLGKCNV